MDSGWIRMELDFYESRCKDNPAMNLKVALMRGSVQNARLLLENGAKVTGPEWYESSPAHFAFCAKKNRKELLSLLLEYGLDTSFSTEVGENLLHQFIRHHVAKDDQHAVEIVETLINNFGISATEPADGWSPLTYSIHKGNMPLILFFLNNGAAVDYESLQLVVRDSNDYLLEMLLSKVADFNSRDELRRTLLHDACMHHCEKLIRILIRYGADLSAIDEDGRTPFNFLEEESVPRFFGNYEQSLLIMVKEFSKLSFENLPILKEDLDLIKMNPKAQEYFVQCKSELQRMSDTKFYGPHSYYSVLKMSKNVKKLATLLKNEEFLLNLEKNLHSFDYYKCDLETLLNEAVRIKNESLVVYSRLKTIFGEIFPDVIIRNVTENLTLEDLVD